MLSIGAQLNESVRLVQTTETEEIFQYYRLQVAMLMATIQDKVMNPLYAEHPDLVQPERDLVLSLIPAVLPPLFARGSGSLNRSGRLGEFR
ncbi:hypothetical protein [Vitiosangium sp. GDMCC 1.1324]|uniref:hypothetical protein n=1 Tax=Vitiosangium sp. (strain GDMCC 1.1324) TaxID=2138576 RepID=UPI000D337066|nr:hypothetical protein [Vitiosangium sp. GDMCC 1.1324]PTL76851.1 hypothetical protein DAT35_47095 [Vitiosangium sp. GDMCC 1.1324]